jgi:hypothetical protein
MGRSWAVSIGLSMTPSFVARGVFFPRDYRVPLSEITLVDSGVHLNVIRDAVLASGQVAKAAFGDNFGVVGNDKPLDSLNSLDLPG